MLNVSKMTDGSPFRIMIRFAIPLMLSNLLQLFYTLADSAVVGRLLGVRAFAAIGATASLNWFMLSAVIGITIGFGTLFAQRFGAGDSEGLKKLFSSSIPLSLLIGGLIAAAGIWSGRGMLELLRTPADLMDGAALYLSFMLGGMPVTIINLLLGSMLRAMGDSKTPLRAMIFSTILNIILDFVLVFPLGIAGVAIATLVSQLASCVFCARRLRGVQEARFNLREVKWTSIWVLIKIGLPLGFRNAVIEIGSLAIQVLVNGYGMEFVAGIAAAKRMYSLLLIAGGAMEASVGVFVAQNYGANLLSRVKDGIRAGLKLMLGSAFVIMTLTLVFGRWLISFMVIGEPGLIENILNAGQIQLNVMALALPVLHLLFLYRSALQGIGNTVVPMLTGFAELAGRFISFFIFANLWDKWGVYFADATGWVLGAALVVGVYIKVVTKIYEKHS